MEIDVNSIDIERLKNDLINEFMGIAFAISPVVFMNVSEVEKASPEKLVQIAIDNGFDLNDYKVKTK